MTTEVTFVEEARSAVTRDECQRISDLAAGKLVLELGSYWGRSTVALASTARKVHALDWHRGDKHAGFEDTLQHFLSIVEKYKIRDKVAIHVCRFEDLLPLLRPKTFEFVFIDAMHSYEAVKSDIAATVPLLLDGSWIAFHDYTRLPGFGVMKAVDEFAAKNGLKVHVQRSVASLKLAEGKPVLL